jgi:hypothetical protein
MQSNEIQPYNENIFYVSKYSKLNIYSSLNETPSIITPKLMEKHKALNRTFSNIENKIKPNKQVSFLDEKNMIFEINNKEYYTQLNVKKDMWWSFAELNAIKLCFIMGWN